MFQKSFLLLLVICFTTQAKGASFELIKTNEYTYDYKKHVWLYPAFRPIELESGLMLIGGNVLRKSWTPDTTILSLFNWNGTFENYAEPEWAFESKIIARPKVLTDGRIVAAYPKFVAFYSSKLELIQRFLLPDAESFAIAEDRFMFTRKSSPTESVLEVRDLSNNVLWTASLSGPNNKILTLSDGRLVVVPAERNSDKGDRLIWFSREGIRLKEQVRPDIATSLYLRYLVTANDSIHVFGHDVNGPLSVSVFNSDGSFKRKETLFDRTRQVENYVVSPRGKVFLNVVRIEQSDNSYSSEVLMWDLLELKLVRLAQRKGLFQASPQSQDRVAFYTFNEVLVFDLEGKTQGGAEINDGWAIYNLSLFPSGSKFLFSSRNSTAEKWKLEAYDLNIDSNKPAASYSLIHPFRYCSLAIKDEENIVVNALESTSAHFKLVKKN